MTIEDIKSLSFIIDNSQLIYTNIHSHNKEMGYKT